MRLVSEEPPAELPSAEEPDEVAEFSRLDPPLHEERHYPSTIGGLFYLLVLAAGATGIAIVWSGDWRLGIRCLAAGLCFACLLRLVLPKRDAGMLAVRHRLVDVVLLVGVALALYYLAGNIPDQPS